MPPANRPASAFVRIERIESRGRGMQAVVLDDGREIEVSSASVDAAGLGEGMAAAEQVIQSLGQNDESERIHTAALRLLRVRARAERDIRTRLAQKGFEQGAIDGEIRRLREVGLLDDRAFADAFIEERSRRTPRGKRLLQQELSVRGVDRTVAAQSLEQVDDEELAYDLATKEHRKRHPSTYDEFVTKTGPFLVRRGFNHETTRAALRRAWQAAQNGESGD